MCSFCNQNKITGQAYQPTPLDVEQTLGKAVSDLGERTKNAEMHFSVEVLQLLTEPICYLSLMQLKSSEINFAE